MDFYKRFGTFSDLDFADDIALTLNLIDETQKLLINVENEAAKVGLHLNAKKTRKLSHIIKKQRILRQEMIRKSRWCKISNIWAPGSITPLNISKLG